MMTKKLDSDDQLHRDKDMIILDFWYPRSSGNARVIEIGLCDVRAADSIRISYDFDRDGYVITQASKPPFDENGDEQDEDWQEVAFVKTWGREQDGSMHAYAG